MYRQKPQAQAALVELQHMRRPRLLALLYGALILSVKGDSFVAYIALDYI